MALLQILQFLALIIVHHLILTITGITFKYQVKFHLFELMEALVHQRNILVLILLEETQDLV